MSYNYIAPDQGVAIKAWTKGVPVEDAAMEQLRNISNMPFIHSHVAAMPDVHLGMGATVGSVIPTVGAIIPAAVGVDIGCGMMAVKTSLTANDLPDNLGYIRSAIEQAVPHGRSDNGGANDVGGWKGEIPERVKSLWLNVFDHTYKSLLEKHPKVKAFNTVNHLGTLGTGNHFIEMCLDETDAVWIMLHSGSRGMGNRIGSYFISEAKKEMERWFIHLPDKDLSYFPEGSELFDDYVDAVHFAQAFAERNREIMMERTLAAITPLLPVFSADLMAVNCHHNYVAKENHKGKNVFVTRKGAVRAREKDLGIIPGSMGTRSYIVRGKGNAESFHSCSHGAGRKMSRNEARKTFSVQDHIEATHGVECRKDAEVIDETPMAYKDIDNVMAAQSDLVDIVHTLKQIVCVKG